MSNPTDNEASLEKSGRVEDLIKLYESRSREVPQAEEAAHLLTRAGDLARDRLKNLPRAEDLFRRALVYKPGTREALEGLRVLYEQRNDAAALAEVLERMAQGSTGEAAARLYLKVGELFETKLSRRDRAVVAYQLASKALPQERQAYQRAFHLLMEDGRYEPAYECLERERAALGETELLDDYLEFAEALVDVPQEHPLVKKAIERALTRDAENARAQAAQKAVGELEQVWRDKVKALRAQAVDERDRKVAARKSLKVARLLAFYEPTEIEKVQEALERCFALWPAMPDALELLEAVAEKVGDINVAIAAFTKMAADTRDKTAQVDLHLRIGQTLLARKGDQAGAAAAFQKAAGTDPARPDAAELASESLIELGKPDEALATLVRHLQTLKDRDAIVSTRLNLADLAQRLLKDTAVVRAHLDEALKVDPQNARVAFRLAKLLAEEGELGPLWPLMELAASAPRSVDERVALCEYVSMAYDEAEDPQKAFQALAFALPLAPRKQALLDSLDEAAQKAQMRPQLAQALRRAAQVAPADAQLTLWKQQGRLLQALGRPVEAQEAWLEVQKRLSTDTDAQTALGELKKALKEEPQDPRGRLEAEAKKLEASAADPAAAAAVYRQILELDPDSVPTLKKLGAAAANLGAWEEVAVVAERLLALADSAEERQEWRARLGQLYAERLSRREEAVRLYLTLLEERNETATVVGGLERLASQGVRQADISRALAPLYARNGDYQRQVASLLVQLASVPDKAEQKSLLTLLAQTSEKHLMDVRGAFDFRLRGLSLDPADSAFRAEAVRLSRALKTQQELARFVRELAPRVEDTALAVSMLSEAAQTAEEAGAIDDSAAALKEALGRSPDNKDLLARLGQLYFRAARWGECDQILRKRVTLAEGEDKKVLYLVMSKVNRELGRPKEAASALKEAIALGAEPAEHLPQLAELYEKSQQFKELAEVLATLGQVYEQAGDGERASAVAVRRARVLEEGLGDKAEAIARYAEVLASRPSDPDALSALEQFLTDPQHREAAARALLPAYAAAMDHRKQVTVLAVIAEASQDSLERLNAFKQAAQIHTMHLRQPEQAFASLASALRLMPEDKELRDDVHQAAEDADLMDSYAEVLEEILEAGAGAATVPLHTELADVFEKKLSDHERAVKHLNEVLKIDAKNVEALVSLQRLHRAHEEWWELVPIIERLSALEPDPAEKSALDREAALLSEQKLQDLDRAAVNWRQIAARDVLARDAAQALERLYAELSRPQELAFALELRRNQEGQSPQGREVAFRLAQLRQQKLNDPRGALEVYRQVLSEDPAHEGTRAALETWIRENQPDAAAAIEILDPTLARTGDHQRRIALREARLMSATTGAERAGLATEIRAILERDLGQPEAAFMNALKSFTDGIDRDAVQADLERLARATGSFEELAEVYESTSEELEAGDEHKVPLLRRAAEIREQLSEPEDAARVWKLLLKEEPQDRQALDSLSRLYEKTQNAKSLSEVYARKAELATEPSERFELLMKAGESYEAAGDDEQAVAAFKTALPIKRTPEVLEALDRLYGRLHRFAEQADILAQLAGGAADADTRRGLTVRLATLLEKLNQLPEALRAWAAVLQTHPADPQAVAGLERLLLLDQSRVEAARLLEPCYRQLNDLKKLVDVLDVRLAGCEPSRRVELLSEIATLREALGQKSLALMARIRAFADRPDDETVRDELERVAADVGAFEELAAAYEDALERGLDEPLAGGLWRRLAGVYSERLQRFDLSARAWNEVLARDPKDMAVLDALARIYRRTSAYKELSVIMRRQLALETNGAAQVNLLYELANLAEETLSDKQLAVQCYQAILERKPEDPNAIKFLARLLSETERYADLATLLGREVQLAESRGQEEEALELMVRLGRLKLTRLNDARGALNTFQEVLQRKAAHAGAVGALEEMARSDNPLKGAAAETLQPVFAKGGEHLKLVQMMEAQVAAEPQPAERAALLRRTAQIYSQEMDNAEMAFVAAARALRELPDEPKNLELVTLLYRQADAADECIALLGEVAPRASDDAARAELFRALARMQAANDEPDDAVESWKRVMELAPTDQEAMEAIGGLLAKEGRVGELLEVLKRQLTVEEDLTRRVGILFQIGSLQQDQQEDPAAAAATFRRLLELKPDDASALERMDRACEATQRWPELADVLARRIRVAEESEKSELEFRLAVVRETRLLDKSGAVALYAELLEENSQHEGALERLTGLAQREPQNKYAVDVLLDAHRKNGDLLRLAQLIETRVAVSPDDEERKALLAELATVRGAQSEPELAYLALYRAFKEDPNDATLRASLEAAADASHSWDELVSAYEEELPRIAESTDAARVCLKIAQVQDQKLHEADSAVKYYERARQLDQELGPKVLPALDRLYGQLERYDAQADALEALAGISEGAEKAALSFRLGQSVMEHLDKPDRAAAAFEQVLSVDPKHLPSLRSLELLYADAQDNERLFKVLEAQRDLVQGPDRERVLSRMAMVSAEGLSDIESSIGLYRELLTKNPRNEQAFEALSTLLDRGGKHEELRDLLKQKLQVTIDPRELVRLNERLGRVLSQRLDEPDEAIAAFKAALDRDARHRGALEALRDLFERLDRRDDLVIVLRRLIPLQEDAREVKSIRIRLGEVLAATSRREEALDAARRALEVEPHAVEELERVHAIFESLKAWGDAVRALELTCDTWLVLEDREAAVKALFRVADTWRGPAGKAESAGPALERILEIDPANREAYEQALKLYSSVNDWRSYATVMDHFVRHLVTDDEKLATLRELANVQETRLGQRDLAFLQYTRALQLDASDDFVREEVERLAEETESYDELAAVYEQVAEELPRGPLAERIYLTLARVQDQKLDDADEAEKSLRKILEFDPTNEQALERLSSMFARRGQNKEYIVSLEQQLEAAGSIERRKEILREIARIYDEQLDRPDDAENALLRALDLEADAGTLTILASLQRRQKRFDRVASTLLRMRDVAPTPEERSRIQVEVAQVYERDLNDDEAAVEGYRQALEFDPANTPALDALERLNTRLDRPADLLAVYERQLEITTDYRERVKILFKSAAIWEERYQNLANADACIEAALQIDPQNLQAIKSLERLRKAQERWDELIGVVDRHIQLLSSNEEKAELCVEMGDIFHQQLKAVDRAVVAYHQALELFPRCRPAMHALGMLYERSGNWPFALDMLAKEAQVAGDTSDAVELYYRQGKINEDMLMDAGSARSCYMEALRIDAGYVPAIRALKGIYELERDFDNYEKALVEEARQTQDPHEKARAFVEVAKYYENKEDRDQAAENYEEALKLEGDLADAARPLADIYLSREDWAGCERMLDIVTSELARQFTEDPDNTDLARELCRRYYRLGYVCEKLDKRDKALAVYEKAYQLDSTYLAVLEGYGNLLVQVKRFEEAQKVYQTILLHHRDELTDLEVAEIYWTLGDLNVQQRQPDRASNHFEKALSIDPNHEGSLRAMVEITEGQQNWEKAGEYLQKLVEVLDGDARFEAGVKLGALARDRLSDPYMAIDAYLAAHREQPATLEVMDALYVLYRETRQGTKAAEILEKMLATEELRSDPAKARRVYFALGELCRDEIQDLDRAEAAFNAALDLDWRFIDAFSALEAMLGKARRWKQLDDNYKRMLSRFPKTEETHLPRMTVWRALGDLYLNVLKSPEAAVEVYKVVAAGLHDDVAVQEQYAALAQTQAGYEQEAVDAWRRALPTTANPGKVASALAELAARRKDYDSAWLAAQVSAGLIGEPGAGEKEILTKLTPYAKKREQSARHLTDRLWQQHLFHPRVRGPMAELMAILFEQAGGLYKEDFQRYGINPRRHLIDIGSAQEYQIHHYRYVSRLLGMEQVALFSPFLVATRDRLAKKSTDPAPDPMVGVEICHTEPVALRVGGKFFKETGQKEVYYLLARTMALLRPELALTQRLSAERLEAVLQAAISLSVDRFRFSADPRAIDTERKLLEKHLTPQARTALARVTNAYVKVATPNDLRNFIEGAELSASRAGAFVAGDIEPVKRMVMAESGSAYRVQPRSKIRDLMVFALGDDLHALRVAVGTNVEVQLRK